MPKAVRDRILAEFNHRCAVCGDPPHLHHIDGNPANNEPENLLPLCPNHHLTDQHNPTAPVDPRKLRLFRHYKDPVILSSQFHPLYLRFIYLMGIQDSSEMQQAREATVELVAFVNAMKMGGFYHARIADLLVDQAPNTIRGDEPEQTRKVLLSEKDALYKKQVLANRTKAVDLLIEMLRYQDWPAPAKKATSEA